MEDLRKNTAMSASPRGQKVRPTMGPSTTEKGTRFSAGLDQYSQKLPLATSAFAASAA